MARPDPLYLTESEIAQRIGLPLARWSAVAIVLERKGLPRPDTLFDNRRYWPAVRAFLDRRYDLDTNSSAHGNPAVDGEEQWNERPTQARRRA